MLNAAVEAGDAGFTVKASGDGRAVIIGSSAGLIDDRQAEAVRTVSPGASTAIFTYLANTMRVGDREVPYSLVTGIDGPVGASGPIGASGGLAGIVLNTWAARELRAQGRRRADDGVLRLGGAGAARHALGRLPRRRHRADRARAAAIWRRRIPASATRRRSSDWDPPFPIDLRRIRPVDEDVLGRLSHDAEGVRRRSRSGSDLWRSRYGAMTSIRVAGRRCATAAAREREVGRAARAARSIRSRWA